MFPPRVPVAGAETGLWRPKTLYLGFSVTPRAILRRQQQIPNRRTAYEKQFAHADCLGLHGFDGDLAVNADETA